VGAVTCGRAIAEVEPSRFSRALRPTLRLRRQEDLGSNREPKPAPNDPHLQRPTLLAQPFDVERQGLLSVRCGFLEILALSVQSRQLGRIGVVAAARFGLEAAKTGLT